MALKKAMFQVRVWLRKPANRLWLSAVGSAVGLAVLARMLNGWMAADAVPEVSRKLLDDLLSVVASSMLVEATF